MISGTIRTVIPIASAMRSMDDKRGSRLPLSISDKCCYPCRSGIICQSPERGIL